VAAKRVDSEQKHLRYQVGWTQLSYRRREASRLAEYVAVDEFSINSTAATSRDGDPRELGGPGTSAVHSPAARVSQSGEIRPAVVQAQLAEYVPTATTVLPWFNATRPR